MPHDHRHECRRRADSLEGIETGLDRTYMTGPFAAEGQIPWKGLKQLYDQFERWRQWSRRRADSLEGIETVQSCPMTTDMSAAEGQIPWKGLKPVWTGRI